MSAPQMIPFAGWADTGWQVIAKKSRVLDQAMWTEIPDAPMPLEAAMQAAHGGQVIAQRHDPKTSFLLWRPRRGGRA